jgi:hypothetical protein
MLSEAFVFAVLHQFTWWPQNIQQKQGITVKK